MALAAFWFVVLVLLLVAVIVHQAVVIHEMEERIYQDHRKILSLENTTGNNICDRLQDSREE